MEILATISQGSEITISIGVLIFIVIQTGGLVVAWYNQKNKISLNKQDIEYLQKENIELKALLLTHKKEISAKMDKRDTEIFGALTKIKEDMAFVKGKLEKK